MHCGKIANASKGFVSGAKDKMQVDKYGQEAMEKPSSTQFQF
jgi:hypothetical protein